MKLIAGPCIIEGRDVVLRIAERLRDIVKDRPVDFVFKASYDKANRTSGKSYRGLGMDAALAILADVKREVGVRVNTDIHDVAHIEPVAAVVDTLQIPAFLCRQTDLLMAAGASGKPVMIKKGQFMAPADMKHAVAKVKAGGGTDVSLCERGASFGYNNLVVDFRSLMIMREFAPVIFDGTHSVQLPGGLGGMSGGDRRYIAPLVRAAAAVGIDGLFLECHEDPSQALCDGPNQLPLDELPGLLDEVERIRAALS